MVDITPQVTGPVSDNLRSFEPAKATPDPAAGLSRRAALAAGAAGLLIGLRLPGTRLSAHAEASAAADTDGFVPNAFLRIAPDDTITVISKHIEFGQGPYTGIATILADELDARPDQIRVVSAPANVALYANTLLGVQGTGGSSAMANSWVQLRMAGAQARARLVQAAAGAWNVPMSEIAVADGVVTHASGRTARFGDLAARAATVSLSAEPVPKDPARWTYIGKRFKRVDTAAKSNGTANYTIDVQLPDMLTCLIARPSRFGATVKSFDAKAALTIEGVAEVVAVPMGVAVLATGFWPAKQGRDALKVEWDETGTESRSSADLLTEFHALAQKPGSVARNEGDVEAAFAKAATVVEARYTFPYLAHAPMEPNDCVIRRTADGVELSYGCQMPTVDQMVAASVLGLRPEQVAIKTLLAGGSFGRRATPNGEMAFEAAHVMLAARHQGPIKVLWTREDDITGGRYRPLFVHHVRGGLDDRGTIIAWDQTIVGQSFMKGSPFEALVVKNGIDGTMVEGASTLPYAIPNMRVSVHDVKVGVPTLWWRSVGSTHTGLSTEMFLDQLAASAGLDALEIRRRLLAKHPRHLAVLNLAAEKAGWGGPLPNGTARGIAVHESFRSFVAQVAEVSKGADGLPKVNRVVCAVDCGVAINPDVVRAQMEGGIAYGLSAALYGAIDMVDGRIQQTNFDSYRVLRMAEMPRIEVHIVQSSEPPTGVGEPGVPPIAPAVANAWSVLTGTRVAELPFSRAVAKNKA